MDTYSFTEYSALSMNSTESLSPWSSSTGEYIAADAPGLPAYSSHILNFDPAPSLPRTLFQREHYVVEAGHSRNYSTGHANNHSSYADSYAHSPFLAERRSLFTSQDSSLASRSPIHSPPPENWDPSNNREVFVNVTDLTTSGSSAGNSPNSVSFYDSAPQTALYDYTEAVNPQEYRQPRGTRGKHTLPSSPRSPEGEAYASHSSGSASASSASSYDDDGSYSDSDSLYLPSHGRPSTSHSRKRARGVQEDNYIQIAEGGKKSRGRKVPVAPDLSAVEGGGEIKGARLASIPFGIKKTGSSNKTKRRYVCTYEGCGKCFIRGEHLKRHVKSLHLCEKRKLRVRAVATNTDSDLQRTNARTQDVIRHSAERTTSSIIWASSIRSHLGLISFLGSRCNFRNALIALSPII